MNIKMKEIWNEMKSYGMVWKALSLFVSLFCVGWGFSMTAKTQDTGNVKINL
jgi:hypothetical protein